MSLAVDRILERRARRESRRPEAMSLAVAAALHGIALVLVLVLPRLHPPPPPLPFVPVQIIPGVFYPAYRLSIIVVALAVAALLYVVVMRTKIGMLIRAGASNREMIGALGINIKLLFTLVFGLGAALAGLAGLMQAPILTVQIGMGENILILAFVIIVIGGIGSIRGAFLAAIFVGMIDTLGRAFLPDLLRMILSSSAASTAAPALSSMLIYLLMAIVLVVRPEGLFPAAKR